MARKRTAKRSDRKANSGNGANLGFEATLWAAADKLRGHIDTARLKHLPPVCVALAAALTDGERDGGAASVREVA